MMTQIVPRVKVELVFWPSYQHFCTSQMSPSTVPRIYFWHLSLLWIEIHLPLSNFFWKCCWVSKTRTMFNNLFKRPIIYTCVMQQFYHRMHKVVQDLSSFWALEFSPTSIVAELHWWFRCLSVLETFSWHWYELCSKLLWGKWMWFLQTPFPYNIILQESYQIHWIFSYLAMAAQSASCLNLIPLVTQ